MRKGFERLYGLVRERPHPGRQELPAHLPRVERIVACAPEQRVCRQCMCKQCGGPTEVIGYDTSEQLDVEPAKYYALVTRREKRACGNCQAGGVATAPDAARIIDKSLASDQVILDTVMAKYSDSVGFPVML